MPTPKKPTLRGGSDSARKNGLVGIVVHVTPEERREIGVAAAMSSETAKGYVRRVALEDARRVAGKIPQNPQTLT